jgi:hypothetical protein
MKPARANKHGRDRPQKQFMLPESTINVKTLRHRTGNSHCGYSFVGPPLVGWPKDAVRAKPRRHADKRRPYKESPDSGGVVLITMGAI